MFLYWGRKPGAQVDPQKVLDAHFADPEMERIISAAMRALTPAERAIVRLKAARFMAMLERD